MAIESDEIVYSRFLKDRDSEALRTLLERHREGLTLFIYGYVRNMEDAEDIMLNAFAVAAAEESGFSGKSTFKTWLFGIGRNLARKHLRKQKLQFWVSDTLEETSSEKAEDELIKGESRRELYNAMNKLPDDYKNALYLVYFEDMSHEEVAEVMHKTKKQIYNLVFRGKQTLKGLLEEAGIENAEY